MKLSAFAPAKINLGLKITGRFANGYHRLETIFVPVSVFDYLTTRPGTSDTVYHTWPDYAPLEQRQQLALGLTKNPLILKTLHFVRGYLRDTAGITLPPQTVNIHKRIPSPSGLGGASSDAAALIHALLSAHAPATKITEPFLKDTSGLGADVPFFLYAGLAGHSAQLNGIGHELATFSTPPLGGFIIVPPFGFSTAKMFAYVRTLELPVADDTARTPQPNLTLRLNEIPCSDSLAGGVRIVQNDFDAVARAVFPAESRLLARAKKQVALTVKQFLQGDWMVGMTGSGAGLFAATDAHLPATQRVPLARILAARLGELWRVLPFQSLK